MGERVSRLCLSLSVTRGAVFSSPTQFSSLVPLGTKGSSLYLVTEPLPVKDALPTWLVLVFCVCWATWGLYLEQCGHLLRTGAMYCRQRVALDASKVDLRAGLAVGAFALWWGLGLSCSRHNRLTHGFAATLANALVLHCNREACTGAVHLSPSLAHSHPHMCQN